MSFDCIIHCETPIGVLSTATGPTAFPYDSISSLRISYELFGSTETILVLGPCYHLVLRRSNRFLADAVSRLCSVRDVTSFSLAAGALTPFVREGRNCAFRSDMMAHNVGVLDVNGLAGTARQIQA